MIALFFTFNFVLPIFGAVDNMEQAKILQKLGLFEGTEKGFELDRGLTRAEGTAMVLRLKGMEQQALTNGSNSSFDDVSGWSEPYIAEAEKQDIVKGVGNNKFAPGDPMTSRMYVTLVLRSMGYTKNTWQDAFKIAEQVGLILNIDSTRLEKSDTLLRKDVVMISYNALKTRMNNQAKETLLDDLIAKQVIKEKEASEVIKTLRTELSAQIQKTQGIVEPEPKDVGKPQLTKEELGDVELIKQIENIAVIWDDLKEVKMTDPTKIESNIIIENQKPLSDK